MSKIGALNLELQEQANELGFSTVLEAIDAGCTIKGDKLCEPTIDFAEEEAHNEWQDKVESTLKKLDRTITQLKSFGYDWAKERADDLRDVEKFILEGNHE